MQYLLIGGPLLVVGIHIVARGVGGAMDATERGKEAWSERAEQ